MQPLLQWENSEYYLLWVCVCSFSYPACKAHCGLPRSTVFFPHYLINCTIFEKKALMNIKCVFWFSLKILSETFLKLRSTEQDKIKMCIGLHVKYPLFLSDFNENWIFLTDFEKMLKHQISWKSVQWEPSSREQTDMTKLKVAFRNFANASTNSTQNMQLPQAVLKQHVTVYRDSK